MENYPLGLSDRTLTNELNGDNMLECPCWVVCGGAGDRTNIRIDIATKTVNRAQAARQMPDPKGLDQSAKLRQIGR